LRSLGALVVTLAVCALGSAAAAQPDPCLFGSEPWVAVAFQGTAFSPELERAVLLDLRAGLRLKGIEACVIGQAGKDPPLAVLELSANSPEHLSVSIVVHDALTEKRVQREVDLTDVATDARSLTIAAATDELLRASWVELALSDAPKPKREPPPEVQAAVRDTIEPARVGRRDLALGARVEAMHFGAGLTWLGGDVLATAWPFERVGLELSLGARAGLPRQATHGELETSALAGSLALRVALSDRHAPLGVDGLASVAVAGVRMRGDAELDAASAAGSAMHVHALGSFLFRAAATEWLDVRLELGAGATLRSVAATDGGSVFASTGGLALRAALGAEIKL
jgi:hypothetical protein